MKIIQNKMGKQTQTILIVAGALALGYFLFRKPKTTAEEIQGDAVEPAQAPNQSNKIFVDDSLGRLINSTFFPEKTYQYEDTSKEECEKQGKTYIVPYCFAAPCPSLCV